jgi:hypothetical protein
MRIVLRWRESPRDFTEALRLTWLVIGVWLCLSALGLYFMRDATFVRQLTAWSLTLWPFAAVYRIIELQKKVHSRGPASVARIYSILLQTCTPCFAVWIVLLFTSPP